MNNTNVVELNQELATVQSERASSLSIITNDANMSRALKLSELMASSKITVPAHLQNNAGDCLAIILQAMNFGMDPFIVAQKTHIVSGKLGYEAQLVNAIVQSSNAIKGAFSYEYKDEGGSGANAFVTCRVGAVLKGQKDITWGEWLPSASVTTKNSPLWKTNVKQQMGYLQVKNWARLYCPAAIMGVYSTDELQDMPPQEKDVTPVNNVKTEPPVLDDAAFKVIADKYKESVIAGKKSVENFVSWVESKGALMTDAQKDEVQAWAKKPVIVEGEAKQVDDDFVKDMNNAEGQAE